MRISVEASSNHAGSIMVAKCAQCSLVVRPALAHAYPGFEEHLAPEQALHLLASPGADLAQALAALADHDQLLAFAFDPYHCADAQQVAAFRRGVLDETLDLDRGRVRQLFAELAHQLLAHEFPSEKA